LHCRSARPAGFDQIAKCKALRVLDLGSNNIDFSLSQFWRSFRFLKTLPKLNWLSFEGNACEQSIPYFRYCCRFPPPKLTFFFLVFSFFFQVLARMTK
jgi:hypothetical protein